MKTQKSLDTTLTIDPEFRALLPGHSAEEADGLHTQLEADGCEDSIKVWKHAGQWVIVDGQHRYARCLKRGIPFAIEEKEFASRAEAMEWMIRRHLGQRNLNTTQRAMLVAKLVTTKHGGNRVLNSTLDRTTIAKAAELGNVGQSAVREAKKVAERGSAALQQAAAEGSVAISAAAAVAALPKAEQTKIVKEGSKAVKAKAKAIKEKAVESPAEPKEPERDGLGNLVPEHLLPIFVDSIGSKLLTAANKVRRGIRKELATSVEHNWLLVETINQAERVASALKDIKPYCLCLACKGKKGGCKVCRATGYWPRKYYDSEQAKGNV